jgi:hypothetical protein
VPTPFYGVTLLMGDRLTTSSLRYMPTMQGRHEVSA